MHDVLLLHVLIVVHQLSEERARHVLRKPSLTLLYQLVQISIGGLFENKVEVFIVLKKYR